VSKPKNAGHGFRQ